MKFLDNMPKPSEIKVKPKTGTVGSHIDIKTLIEERVVLNILDFELKDSAYDGKPLCIMQLEISSRLMITWHGSNGLINYLKECKNAESDGEVCFPIEDCIIIQNSDGSYAVQDADESCTKLTAEDLDDLASKNKRKRRFK